MSDYISMNKLAWEEAFDHKADSYQENTIKTLKKDPETFFSTSLKQLLVKHANSNKRLAQYCCNNGRETMASLIFGYHNSTGFDLASNMIASANNLAKELSLNATFIESDILKLSKEFDNQFDVGLITVGALTWFKNLDKLFASIGKTLNKGAYLLIEDMHPVVNMIAAKGEKQYNSDHPSLLVYDYFSKEPWVEVDGMGYMTENTYKSKAFTSHVHPLEDIINGLIKAGFELQMLKENNIDQSNLFSEINNKNVPLTFIIEARKVR